MAVRELADTTPLTIDRVLLWTFFVVVFVSLLEQGLHKLGHICKQHNKYNEMLQKITGELMVVGLIYLIVKLICYFNVIQYGGVQYYSLDAADMLLFFVALALVMQSLIVFLRLRMSNSTMNKIMITKPGALANEAEKENKALNKANWFSKTYKKYRMRRKLEDKVLEVYFCRIYDLPPLFVYSKYVREIQECQVVDLVEIDVLGYGLLLLLLAAFFACTGELQINSLYRSSYDMSSDTYKISSQMDDERKWVFKFFAWSLTLAMVLMAAYLKYLNNAVFEHATTYLLQNNDKTKPYDDRLIEALNMAENADEYCNEHLSFIESIEKMKWISKEISKSTFKERKGLFKDNLMVQLLKSIFRKCTGTANDMNRPLNPVAASLKMPLPFSRKFVQFCVRTFLIVNGLYYSMLIACVVPSLSTHELPILALLVVPLLINTFWLSPLLVHKFSILDGTWKADPKKLLVVIDHIIAVEKRDVKMVKKIQECIADDKNSLTLASMKDAMEIADKKGDGDGYLDIEVLMDVLSNFGFDLPKHKFYTLVHFKYSTMGTRVKYQDVYDAFVPVKGSFLASHPSFQA